MKIFALFVLFTLYTKQAILVDHIDAMFVLEICLRFVLHSSQFYMIEKCVKC